MEFPDFDENLRLALEQEVTLFFDSQLREDHPIAELLTARYTFLNERLARHYGIPNVYGDHFRRVDLTDEARRGLIGKGAVLTVTSYPNRTSPVLRGKWLLDNIFGAPPPPPPPNVPTLKENVAGEQAFRFASAWSSIVPIRRAPAAIGSWIRSDLHSRISMRSASGGRAKRAPQSMRPGR